MPSYPSASEQEKLTNNINEWDSPFPIHLKATCNIADRNKLESYSFLQSNNCPYSKINLHKDKQKCIWSENKMVQLKKMHGRYTLTDVNGAVTNVTSIAHGWAVGMLHDPSIWLRCVALICSREVISGSWCIARPQAPSSITAVAKWLHPDTLRRTHFPLPNNQHETSSCHIQKRPAWYSMKISHIHKFYLVEGGEPIFVLQGI